jgi:hypothetical protein
MKHLQQSLATLRIWGDDLVPQELTAALGREPTFACAKGEEISGLSRSDARIAATGAWHLQTPDCAPADVDAQVRELLAGMTGDMAVWRKVREKHRIDLFCGLFMGHGNEGLAISPYTLVSLGVRGIELALDLYAPRVEG